MKSSIVLGLGYGDEGKGLTTDALCSHGERPLVVRFSGGQQAGHTVMRDGKKHIFSNYGAGTLRDVPSYFTEDTSFYLNTMEMERRKLSSIGINPSLTLHSLAKMTTPYDVAYNRLLEKVNQHGSVGLGIAATHKRDLDGYKLHAMDYFFKDLLAAKLDKIKDYYIGKVEKEGYPRRAFLDIVEPQEKFFLECVRGRQLFNIGSYDIFLQYDHLIFEGSQGIMLDMDHGVFPNVTWGNTTSKNVWKYNPYPATTYYVTRCYQTRHGNGWMSSKEDISLINNEEEINQLNEWQGSFKIKELDYSLLNYAISVDELYNKSPNSNDLVVTCLDQRPDFSFDPTRLDKIFNKIYESRSPKEFKIG